jgi:hypothetical protein
VRTLIAVRGGTVVSVTRLAGMEGKGSEACPICNLLAVLG